MFNWFTYGKLTKDSAAFPQADWANVGCDWTLTLHWTPGVEPRFHQLISHFDVFNASDHSKGEMSLQRKDLHS